MALFWFTNLPLKIDSPVIFILQIDGRALNLCFLRDDWDIGVLGGDKTGRTAHKMIIENFFETSRHTVCSSMQAVHSPLVE